MSLLHHSLQHQTKVRKKKSFSTASPKFLQPNPRFNKSLFYWNKVKWTCTAQKLCIYIHEVPNPNSEPLRMWQSGQCTVSWCLAHDARRTIPNPNSEPLRVWQTSAVHSLLMPCAWCKSDHSKTLILNPWECDKAVSAQSLDPLVMMQGPCRVNSNMENMHHQALQKPVKKQSTRI